MPGRFHAGLLCAVLALSSAKAGPAVTVDSLAGLEAALRDAQPGSTVVLAEGDYTTKGPIRIEGKRGTRAAPIVIRAEPRGKAVIGGTAGFALRDCEHMVLEGFTFANDANQQAVLLDNCRQVRVTRNTFRPSETSPQRHMQHWVYLIGARSASNRVDHNRFERKINSGSPIFVRGDDAALVCSQHDRIDHNLFRDVIYAGGTNGHETIRTGGNDLGAAGRSSYALIESNLLVGCSGEDEIMSLKSSDNVVRGNTLLDCRGAICLRLGNRNEVSGNFVMNAGGGKGYGGVKLYGHDHRVHGNHFEGLTGRRHEAPLALVPGTMDRPSTDQIGKRYQDSTAAAPTRAWIAHNTWIDCAALQFGFPHEDYRPFAPNECTFVSNLVVRTKPLPAPPVNLERVRDLRAYDNVARGFGPSTNDWSAWFHFPDSAPPRSLEGPALRGDSKTDAAHSRTLRPLGEEEVGPDAP